MLTKDEAFRLTRFTFDDLADSASAIRDDASMHRITYSPRVYLPVTHLCKENCAYCEVVKDPQSPDSMFMNAADIRALCATGVQNQCSQAQFTLGETLENRIELATAWLRDHGYSTTVDYLADMSRIVITEFGMLPHVDSGSVSGKEVRLLKEVSISQQMMLESIAGRLCEPGGPNFGSPDRTPARRLATLEAAGRAQVPFSTGLLVGIGDTRHERVEGMLAIRDLNSTYGHIQELVIKNTEPQSDIGQAIDSEEYLWTVAAARMVLENSCHIQASTKYSNSVADLVRAGVDDLGGISFIDSNGQENVNPWSHLKKMSDQFLEQGKKLKARATIYPEFISNTGFLAEHLRGFVDAATDDRGYLKHDPLRTNELTNIHDTKENKAIDLTELEQEEDQRKSRKVQKRGSNLPTSKPSK